MVSGAVLQVGLFMIRRPQSARLAFNVMTENCLLLAYFSERYTIHEVATSTLLWTTFSNTNFGDSFCLHSSNNVRGTSPLSSGGSIDLTNAAETVLIALTGQFPYTSRYSHEETDYHP